MSILNETATRLLDVARKLERERDEARERAEELRNVVDPALASMAGVPAIHPWKDEDDEDHHEETAAEAWERGMNEGMAARRERE